MFITIAYIGNSNSKLNELERDYIKKINRIGNTLGLKEIILKKIKNSSKKNITERKEDEFSRLSNIICRDSFNILLDRKGIQLDSINFSKIILKESSNSKNLIFFIGGSDGVEKKNHKHFDKILSFGALTWPHKMFRVMLLEQIYRSITILNNHPYHK